jgi:hypothetical protein
MCGHAGQADSSSYGRAGPVPPQLPEETIEDGSAAASGAIATIMTADSVWASTAGRAGTGTSEGVLFVLAGLPSMIPNLSVRSCRSTFKLRLSVIADVVDINDGAGTASSRRGVEDADATVKSTAGVATTSTSLGVLVMHLGIEPLVVQPKLDLLL